MKIKTNVKAGGHGVQHNQTAARGLKLRTNVRAASLGTQHNQKAARSLKVKTNIRVGFNPQPDPPGVTNSNRA